MLTRLFPAASLVGVALCLIAAPQDAVDREKYARDYVQFLSLELDQWTAGFPHAYNLAIVKPGVDATKLSEAAKAGANDLRAVIVKLHALSAAPNVVKSAGFKGQLSRALDVAKPVNEAMGTQRFTPVLQSDWEQIRSNLNNLARIYQLEQLAILEPPSGGGRGGGRGGRGAPTTAAGPSVIPGGLAGYIVDKQCAVRGKGMWVNTECVKRCLREGDLVVLVTEEGKVYSITNPDKIDSDAYAQKVTLMGKTEGDFITVESVK